MAHDGKEIVEEVGYFTAEIDGIPLGASPDGFIGEGGVEIKCPYGKRDDDGPVFSELKDMPHYMYQVQMCLLVTGLPWWDFFQWAPYGVALERVYPDPDFWDTVKHDIRSFYIQMVDVIENGDVVGSSSRFSAAAEDYRLAKITADAAKADMDAAKAALVALCEENDKTEAQGMGVRISRVERFGGVDYKKLCEKFVDEELIAALSDDYRKAGTVSWRITIGDSDE